MYDGFLGVKIQAAIGKRIGRHVHNAHDQGAPSQLKNPRSDVPLKNGAHVRAILGHIRVVSSCSVVRRMESHVFRGATATIQSMPRRRSAARLATVLVLLISVLPIAPLL